MELAAVEKLISDYGISAVLAGLFVIAAGWAIKIFFKYVDRYLDNQIPIKGSGSAFNAPAVTVSDATPVPPTKSFKTPADGVDVSFAPDTWPLVAKHPVFSNNKILVDWGIPKMGFGDEGRTAVFRDLLAIYIDVWDEILRALVSRIESRNNPDPTDFISQNSTAVLQAIQTAQELWKENGIPAAVYDKFMDWVRFRIDNVLDDIQVITYSRQVPTLPSRMFEVLNHYRSMLRGTVFEAEAAMRLLNGELTGLLYKGIVIGPDSDGHHTAVRAVYDRRKESSSKRGTTDDGSDCAPVPLSVDTTKIRRRVMQSKETNRYEK